MPGVLLRLGVPGSLVGSLPLTPIQHPGVTVTDSGVAQAVQALRVDLATLTSSDRTADSPRCAR
jgi:hypothetical protein